MVVGVLYTQDANIQKVSTDKFFSLLKAAKVDGSIMLEIAMIEKQDLLILDDFGIHPFDNQSRATLLDIIGDRHDKHSTIKRKTPGIEKSTWMQSFN